MFILIAHAHQHLSIFLPFHVLVLKSGMGYQLVSKTYSEILLKKTIRTKLIEILETENSYAEIDTLINKMKNYISN